MSAAFLVPEPMQPTVPWRDGTFTQVLAAAATNGQVGIGRFRANHGDATAYHLHTREDEIFLLLQGTALLWCDDEELELSAGGVAFLPRNVPHAYRITSATAELLVVCTPGGFEGVFLQSGLRLGEEGHPTRQELRRAFDDFGQVEVGPPR